MLTPETIEQIERRALEIQADIERKSGPYYAEIVPGSEPLWHLLATVPTAENDAIDQLSARRFGVWSPEAEVIRMVRGRKVAQRRRLFPGHVLLFVWDVMAHWRRIMNNPAVTRILSVDERPVVVPFKDIRDLQVIEFYGVEALTPRRRHWRKKKGRMVSTGPDVISISPKSYWSDVTTLDDDGRNRLLHKALGLEVPRTDDSSLRLSG